jgi:hypothetical protein
LSDIAGGGAPAIRSLANGPFSRVAGALSHRSLPCQAAPAWPKPRFPIRRLPGGEGCPLVKSVKAVILHPHRFGCLRLAFPITKHNVRKGGRREAKSMRMDVIDGAWTQAWTSLPWPVI